MRLDWIRARELLVDELYSVIESEEGRPRDPTDLEIEQYCSHERIVDVISGNYDAVMAIRCGVV